MDKKTFVLSDETPNSYGIVVRTAGIELGRFQKNPVMLWMHERGEVIGKWNDVRVEGTKLIGTPEFDVEDEDGKGIARKVEKGFVNATSIGLVFSEDDVTFLNDVLYVNKCELNEVSFVDIPSNHNSVHLYDTTGKELTEGAAKQLKLSFQNNPTNPTKTDMEKVTLIALALAAGLTDKATESELQLKIEELKGDAGYKTKYEALVLKQQQEQDAKALQLVSAAINDKRLSADKKDGFLKLAKSDFELFESTLSSLPKPLSLAAYAKSGAVDSAEAQKASWSFEDWRKNDPKGLMKLKAENPTRFDELYQAQYAEV